MAFQSFNVILPERLQQELLSSFIKAPIRGVGLDESQSELGFTIWPVSIPNLKGKLMQRVVLKLLYIPKGFRGSTTL